ncbi:MAG: hypothetical protein ACI97A_004058 [Planctomycetota bacterium]|jgi:hypothetical protein
MSFSSRLSLWVCLAFTLAASFANAATFSNSWQDEELPPRAVRRDIPLTNSIRRAHRAGTRDKTGRPGPNYWQLETDYKIEVRLDQTSMSLFGQETITLHNNSKDDLTRIMVRLDHNIFRGDVPRGASVPAETTEGMVVTRISVQGEDVQLTAPNPNRRRTRGRKLRVSRLKTTLATITLANPIKAGSKAFIEIDWHTKLPGGEKGVGHRMTQRWGDTLFQPTQWFPRIAKYDDLRGWDTNIYLGPAEFYNNFGRFDVAIDAPAGWLVSATGVLQNPEEVLTEKARANLAKVLKSDDEVTIVSAKEVGPGKSTQDGKRLKWHYVADKVNDFVWATAENFVWKATRATIPGRGPIPIHMLQLPERADRFTRAGAISRHALEFYSKLWAPYPFPQLTLQDGPSAGMEYPMVINSNAGAADHEVAHQWWPMMLGTNETWYGWMDEGFNMYMNVLSRADVRGQKPNLNRYGQRYGGMSGNEAEPPMMWSSNYGGSMYGFQTYSKAPMMFSMLGGIVGDEAVQDAIRAYTQVWKFKHPSPWDFIYFMNKELKQDLNWFWYYWLWTTESVDGGIAGIVTIRDEKIVTIRHRGQMPAPVVLKIEFEKGTKSVKSMTNATQVSDNEVIVTWPVDVWFDGRRTFDAKLNFGGRPITNITLDPHARFPDNDTKDNSWPRR